MITLTQDPARTSLAPSVVDGAVAHQYYALVRWLRSTADGATRAPKAIGVTGCERGSGVSTVARNLAAAAAQSGESPVLLLDMSSADLAWPTRSEEPGAVDGRAGAEVERLQERISASAIENLSLLTLDYPGEPNAAALDRGTVNDLIRSLQNDYEFVVVDLPTTESHLCLASAGLLHGVLLVMEAERTRSEVAAEATQRLAQAQANVLGAILNKRPQHLPRWLAARL